MDRRDDDRLPRTRLESPVDGQPSGWAIRAASLLYYLTGVFGGLSNLAVLAYWQRHHQIPVLLAITLDYDGQLDDHTRLARLGAVFILSAGLDVLAARWLWQGRRRGGILGLTLVPVTVVFGIALALPGWLLLAPIRGILVVHGWKTLR